MGQRRKYPEPPAQDEGFVPIMVAKLRANYYRTHVGCNVTTCPNGKCNATGECQDAAAKGS